MLRNERPGGLTDNYLGIRRSRFLEASMTGCCIGNLKSEELDSTTTALDDAIRADFNLLPPEAQAKMLEMPNASDPDNADFWERLLL